MLELVSQTDVNEQAQRRLMRALRNALPSQGRRRIGFPGGNVEHEVRSTGSGSLYYAYSEPDEDSGIPRHWNSFGIFNADGGLQHIVVEINIPRGASDARVAGFFARDPATNAIYLMHDGGVGGGRKGIGKGAFLNYIARNPEPVSDGKNVREALRIADIADPNLTALLWQFVRQVDEFKHAAANGDLPVTDGDRPRPGNDSLDPYFSEFWGNVKGQRSGNFDYTSYHGLVVQTLKLDREANLLAGEEIRKSRLIDLYVSRGKQVIEVYEVKTKADRQSFYTAVGQLMTHGGQAAIRRILVVPKADEYGSDCIAALAQLDIAVRRFSIVGEGVDAKVRLDT